MTPASEAPITVPPRIATVFRAPLRSLDDLQTQQRSRAGGKAAALAFLAARGLPVPPGFVLPAGEDWDEALTAVLREAAAQLLAAAMGSPALSNGPASPTGISPALAVRSSVCCEDGADASFAGQFSTVLNVRDAHTALEAIRTVQASFVSQRVSGYAASIAESTGVRPVPLPAEQVPGAVLIQRQIPAVWAGVCFSADPESGIEQLSVVEGVPGLGEALVSGKSDPFYARLDRRSGRVAEFRYKLPPTDYGSSASSISDHGALRNSSAAALETLIRAVTALCERVRTTLGGGPVDIEWAYDGRTLWLLQARPITTPTFPLPERRPFSEPEVWFHGNFAETMPGPVPRLSWDAVRCCIPFSIWPVDIREWAREAKAAPVESLAGRVCWNVSYHTQAGFLNRKAISLWKLIDSRMATALEELVANRLIVPTVEWTAYQRAKLLMGFLRVNTMMLWRMTRALRNEEAAIAAMGTAWRRMDAAQGPGNPEDLSPAEAWRRTKSLLDAFFPTIEFHLGTFYLLFLPALWGAWASRWSGRTFAECIGQLGAVPSYTTRMERALRLLGRELRAQGILAAGPPKGLPPEGLPPESMPAEARAALQRFLESYGHRGPGEQDFSKPRLAERPALAIELALRASEGGPEIRPELPEGSDRRAEQLIAEVKAKGSPGRLRAAVLSWLLPHARKIAPVREDAKHLFWMPFLQRIRQHCLRVGAGLQTRGLLEQPEDVFHFSVAELDALVASAFPSSQTEIPHSQAPLRKADWLALVQRRKREQARWRRFTFPDVLRSDGVPVAYEGEAQAVGAQEWKGVPVSSGVYEGIARVARTFEEARALESGEVLVTVSVDPGWTTLYPRAGALVMEVGGVLSHGAVVARELGLPAVAGLYGAANLFHTGQRLRVDGRLGTVAVIADKLRSQENPRPEIASKVPW